MKEKFNTGSFRNQAREKWLQLAISLKLEKVNEADYERGVGWDGRLFMRLS